LGDGSRVSKGSLRVETIGEIDELNSMLGLLLCEHLPDEVRRALREVQHGLFDLGGDICIPSRPQIPAEKLAELDAWIEEFNARVAPLKEFILPRGTRAAAHCQVVRAICRRGERALVRLSESEDVNPFALQYLNRLSDLLFILSRVLNRTAGQSETLWRSARMQASKA
jgi:cob(I)alamin adenosyltransferase